MADVASIELRSASLVPPPYVVHAYDVPWGWRIDVTTDERVVRLRHPDDPAVLGIITLERVESPELAKALSSSPDIFQTHVYLQEGERGKGLGIALYAMAFELALALDVTVVSSDDMSDDARRLWKSRRLRSLFDIGRIGPRFILHGVKS